MEKFSWTSKVGATSLTQKRTHFLMAKQSAQKVLSLAYS